MEALSSLQERNQRHSVQSQGIGLGLMAFQPSTEGIGGESVFFHSIEVVPGE